jgi:hypothetical protein
LQGKGSIDYAKIYLCLLTSVGFRTAKGYRVLFGKVINKSADAAVTTAETIIITQILPYSLAIKAFLELLLNYLAIRLTTTLRSG